MPPTLTPREVIAAPTIQLPPSSLRPIVQEILEFAGLVPGWPLGRIALQELEAAKCIGVEPHVLRDARLRLGLPHSRIGRTVVYTAAQLMSVLDRFNNGNVMLRK